MYCGLKSIKRHWRTLNINKQAIENCPFNSCGNQWQDLQKSNDKFIRFCNECEKHVYKPKNGNDLYRFLNQQKCVALPVNNDEFILGGIGSDEGYLSILS